MNSNIKTKGNEIFLWYYTNLPPVHTNRQRGELAKKFSLHMIKEIIEGYEFDLINAMNTHGDEGDIMSKINYWDEIETYIAMKEIQ